KYLLRLDVQEEVGVLAKLASIFSDHGVSVEKILLYPLESDEFAEIVLVTHKASLDHYEDILMELKDYEAVHSIESSYRVEGGEKG
ncbi:ACT domain-containing protein, partial [Micrococcus sp. SIMBA_144]